MVVPEEVQPLPTVFERAASAGFAVSVVSKAQFADSGLTRAALRGARYVGVQGIGDLAAFASDELARMDAGGWFAPRFQGEPVPPAIARATTVYVPGRGKVTVACRAARSTAADDG